MRSIYAVRLISNLYLGPGGFPVEIEDAALTTTWPECEPGQVVVDVSLELQLMMNEKLGWCRKIAALLDPHTPREMP